MTRQLLIYDDPTPLSSDVHRDVSLRQVKGMPQATGLNSVPIVIGEFEKVAAEYPIVFAGTGDGTMPVALLGLGAEENLFLDANEEWIGHYVPAFLRRYPFVFASGADDRLTLCLDMKHPGVNREGRGERLFDAEGNHTRYLEDMLRFVSDYQAQHNATLAFAARIDALGLLEDSRADAVAPDGTRRQLTGFRSLNVARLAALEDDVVLELFRNGMLQLLHLQTASLEQLGALARRLQAIAEATAAPPPQSHAEPGTATAGQSPS